MLISAKNASNAGRIIAEVANISGRAPRAQAE